MRAFIAVFVLVILSAADSLAAPKFTGSTTFKFSDATKSVTFGADGIENSSRENATGTLMVRLWALKSPYQGGTISGKILAEYKLDGLNPASHYPKVSRTVKTGLPSTRETWVLCLTLCEYQSGTYVVTDWRNFSGRTELGPVADFALAGPWSWTSSKEGGTVEMTVAKISHTLPGTTGTLQLSLWATKQPYTGGKLTGWQLGAVRKDGLKAGYTYSEVRNTAKYTAPPPGTYAMTLVLSQWTDGEFRVVAWLPAGQPHAFR